MKIQIALPSQEIGISYTDRCYWSQAPLRLSTYLKSQIPDVKVEFLDGTLRSEYRSIEEVSKRIDPNCDLFGISIQSTYAYKNALTLARIAKESGVKKVILGGHHINDIEIARGSISRNGFIDAICYDKGEHTLVDLLKKEDWTVVPNLVYRDGNTIRITNRDTHPLTINDFPFLDYDLLDLKQYMRIQRERLWYSPTPQAVVFTHEGCWWREKTGGCTFCMIPGKTLVIKSPDKFWNELLLLKKKYGFVGAKDYGDDFTGLLRAKKEAVKRGFSLPSIEDFLATRPQELSDFHLLGYAKTDEITEEVGDLLKSLNFSHLLIGYESGSDRQLRNMRKGTTQKLHLRATKILADRDIKVYAGFVLGTPGEDRESLEETLRFAEKLMEFGNMTTGGASPISIFPGSPDWLELTRVEPKYIGWDDFPIDKSRRDWIKHFCPNLGEPTKALDVLIEYSKRINSLFPEENRLGWY